MQPTHILVGDCGQSQRMAGNVKFEYALVGNNSGFLFSHFHLARARFLVRIYLLPGIQIRR